MKIIELFGYFIFGLLVGGIIFSVIELIISFFKNYFKDFDRHENLHNKGKLSHH